MGLKGLMTYVEKQKHRFYKDYELHDCKLVIDAGSLGKLTNLDCFQWPNLGKSGIDNRCYGGDYDKIEQVLRQFLSALKECNITPYFIYDGMKATDAKIERTHDRLINSTQLIDPDSFRTYLNKPTKFNVRRLHYPYGVKYTFRDVFTELKLNIAVTPNSENDNAASQLAKYLGCPVLGDDSDYFIFGPKYIPLTSLKFPAAKGDRYKYLKCSLLENDRIAKELNTRNKKNMHYILPILMGNDNNYKEQYTEFFEHMFRTKNWQKISYTTQTEKIFKWIEGQKSVECAITEIVKCFKNMQEKNNVLSKIEDIIEEYTPVPIDDLLKHFGFKPSAFVEETIVDFWELRAALDLEIVEKVLKNQNDVLQKAVPEVFMEKELACQNPGFLMEMLRCDRYIMSLNIDDMNQPDSNSAAYDIIRAIYGILVQNPKKRLTVVERTQVQNDTVRLTKCVLPPCQIKGLPAVSEISKKEIKVRKELVFEVLGFEGRSDLWELLNVFPEDSHIFLLAMMYCKEKIEMPKAFIYALILCYMVINYADPKIGGFYRTKFDLQNRFKNNNKPILLKQDENEVLADMTATDLKTFLETLISYFEISPSDTAKTFDHSMMHILSQFNTVFFHLKHLNNLLDWPFKNGYISKVFNGTFLYNLSKKLRSLMEPKQYVLELLESIPTVCLAFNYICEQLDC